jgi:succinate dehydrogenase/fumarate reductase flavoprotein subunit
MEIIIVGAGIAGLGAGVALRRAGHKVTVSIPDLASTLLSDMIQDSRAVIIAAGSGSSHDHQAERLASPSVVGLGPRAVKNGCSSQWRYV